MRIVKLSQMMSAPMTDELMRISYRGAVVSSYGNEAVLVFETEDDIVERTYRQDQFLDGKLPAEGTRVIARFVLTEDEEIEDSREDEFIDLRSHRKNITKGPHIF